MSQIPTLGSSTTADDPGLGPGLRVQGGPPLADPVATISPVERSTEFRPVEGGSDTTSAAGLLIAAYVVMWVLLLAFVWLSHQRQRKLDLRISALEAALDAHEKAATG